MRRYSVVLCGLMALAGCATPTVVQTVKPDDVGLTCPELQREYAEMQRFHDEADRVKGFTGGNVARAVLFWPAILGTYANANEAIAAADTRKVHLANLMSQQHCATPAMPQAKSAPTAPANAEYEQNN